MTDRTNRMFGPVFRSFLLVPLVTGLLVIGCDSTGGNTASQEARTTTISGRVTNSSSSGSEAGRKSGSRTPSPGVEGATVTALSVGADGATRALDGRATTDADGEFTITLDGENVPRIIQLEAEKGAEFSSSVIVMTNGRSQVRAQPMTAETAAEADVYVEAKAQDEASSHQEGVTAADVAMYVNGSVASDLDAEAVQAGDVAAAIAAGVRAETQMNEKAEDGARASAVAEQKTNLYASLQSGLASAGTANERAAVVTAFEDGMANLYVEAGGTAESQARSRQAGTSVVIEFSGETSGDAAIGLRRQAEILRAEATARVEEALFKAEGASNATINALVQARQRLKTDIRAATSIDAMIDAGSTYQATVKSEMESGFEISAAPISVAEAEIRGNVEALFNALANIAASSEGTAQTTVSTYTSFYNNAHASATSSFETTASSSTADTAAKALVYLSAHVHS